MDQLIKIMIADDQTLFLEGLSMVLSQYPEIEILAEASNGQELLNVLTRLQPDIILLDYSMPILDGYETFKVIQQEYPNIKVLILTMHYDESLMVFLMEKGIHGYLLKDEESEVLRTAIHTVYSDGQYFSDYVSKAMLNHLKSLKSTEQVRLKSAQKNQFSQREIEILKIVGQGKRKELAKRLFISVKTVDFHLKNLREKAGCDSTAALVKFAIEHGYQ